MNRIKELRKEKGLTQAEASAITNIPLRTFKMYENDESKVGSIKYNHIIHELEKYGYIDEENGILSPEQIKTACEGVFRNYEVEYAILFGSYAKGSARDKSDVDILISTYVSGLKFFAIAEELREKLKKKVDLLDLSQLNGNQNLLNEILKTGIRIYDQE